MKEEAPTPSKPESRADIFNARWGHIPQTERASQVVDDAVTEIHSLEWLNKKLRARVSELEEDLEECKTELLSSDYALDSWKLVHADFVEKWNKSDSMKDSV
jgi:hypothetical protein